MADILRVEGLSAGYGRTQILDGLDFAMQRGELLGVVGPNGAGKSTLVRVLTGVVEPSSGCVSVDGERLRSRQHRASLVGLVPQHIGLYSHLSGRENLRAFGRMYGVRRGELGPRVDMALDKVGMTSRADRLVGDMSGGMKRRINVAVALLDTPALVIFDEPTAGVDGPARDVIHGLAREVANSGHGVLLVTHELDHAEGLCDTVLVLERGRVRAHGAPSDILRSAFGDRREVVVRFRMPPDAQARLAMLPFGFAGAENSRTWSATTEASQVSFVSALMASLSGGEDQIREVSVRRPGLELLMRELAA